VNVLIDTNVISEVRKGERCDPNVARWYDSIADDSLYLSVLVLGEVRKGIERARPKEPARARALEKWLAAVRVAFAGRILPVDDAVAGEWGRMSAGRPVPVIDGLLAATAKAHGLTLATRNTADVADLGAKVVNPFATAAGK
jgi:hypothetical protein